MWKAISICGIWLSVAISAYFIGEMVIIMAMFVIVPTIIIAAAD